MTLHPEDPRLTAWLLGELTAKDAADVERAVAADPALQLAVRDMENLQRLLTGTLAPGTVNLLPRQRENILQAAREADLKSVAKTTRTDGRKIIPWLFPLTAAAVLTLAVLLLMHLPSSEPGETAATEKSTPPAPESAMAMEIALLPAPGPPDAGNAENGSVRPAASGGLSSVASARDRAMEENGDLFLRKVAERLAEMPVPAEKDLPPLLRRGSVNAIEQPLLPLPVHAGRASLGWVTRSIRGEKKRPPANAVRLEEILNQFALRPAGPASIARGVTLSSESVACPWKPSSTLLLVSFRGAADTAREVTASFKANPSAVRSYRLLGFAPVAGIAADQLPSRLPAKGITSLVIEIESASPEGSLGTLEWTVAGQAAPPVTLVRKSDAEPSDDARFAALVSTYAQWLTGEPSGLIDTDLLAALARESASESLSADRADFLNLIDQSLNLPQE